jgi:MYXO-CTERM domain-containing protein
MTLHRRLLLALGLAAPLSFAVTPPGARAVDLRSEGGFLFDIQDTSDGTLNNGSIDAYDGCYSFSVNGSPYDLGFSGTPAPTSLEGRQVDMPEVTVAPGLSARRFIYVPAMGGDYARYLDVVTNTGTAPVTVSLATACNLGSDGSEVIFSSGSGDTLCDPMDSFCGSDDSEGGGDPALGHVFQGTSPPTRASAFMLGGGNANWSFSVTIPAGGRVALLTFAIQKTPRADVTTEAMRLSEPGDDALLGLDEYLDDIVNFSIAPSGAPRVMFDAPFSADEGAEIAINATVMDLEGDAATWSWDVNGDGTFGDMPGATRYVVPAGTTDGPTTSVRVGIRATDGTNTVERYRSIAVNNLPPVISSPLPPIITGVGANYLHQFEATDPAGPADPLTYTIVRGPEGMAISRTGLLQWIPASGDVTRPDSPLSIEVAIGDGDMGSATQTWQLTVSPNRTPTAPIPLYPVGDVGLVEKRPRLVVSNASDPDYDALTYTFEIDTVNTFDSPALLRMEGVAQTPGYSFWYVPSDLAPGRYFWRARAFDGTSPSEPQMATFYRVPTGDELVDGGTIDGGRPPGDAGVMPPVPPPSRGSDDGCSVAPGARGDARGMLFALALAALFAARRRRR